MGSARPSHGRSEISTGWLIAQLFGSTANNLFVKHAGHDHAIYLQGSTLTNSVAWTPIATGTGEQALELEKSNTVRNVTAYAPAAGGIAIVAIGRAPPGSDTATDTLVNVIARGGTGGAGIRLFQDDNVDLTANVSHSNYSSADVDPDSDESKVHLNLNATNQTAAPLFASAGGGDFHQRSGSPTIDHGANSPANGSADFDGDARTLNGVTDIGADEFKPGPSVDVTPPECLNPSVLLVTCNPPPLPDHNFVLPGRATCILKRLFLCVVFPKVPGAGTLGVQDRGPASKAGAQDSAKKKRKKKYQPKFKRAKAKAKRAGAVKIKLRPTKAGRRILKRKGKLKVTLRVTFTPTGGTPNSKTKKITFKVKKKRKKKKR